MLEVIIVIVIAILFYYGIKVSIKDAQEKRDFIIKARASGLSRRDINSIVRNKKSNESWFSLELQLNPASSVPRTNKVINEKIELPYLTIEQAQDFIWDRLTYATILKVVLEGKNNRFNNFGLSSVARELKIDIDNSTAGSIKDQLSWKHILRSMKNGYTDEFGQEVEPDYELAVKVNEDVINYVGNKFEELKKATIKAQRDEYKSLITEHKQLLDKYVSTFVNLAHKIEAKPDKWGDIDQQKINELKKECIYKIFKALNKEAYSKEKADFSDFWIKQRLNSVHQDQILNGSVPYWIKHLYDIDLPNALEKTKRSVGKE